MEKILTSAMEDYLKLIIRLKQENKVVRVRDIARGMQVKMPSVTSMLTTLVKKNLITHQRYEYVDFTPEGLKQAQKALRKHTVLFDFLKNVLKVNSQQAYHEACRMEHAISSATLKRLVGFLGTFGPRSGGKSEKECVTPAPSPLNRVSSQKKKCGSGKNIPGNKGTIKF